MDILTVVNFYPRTVYIGCPKLVEGELPQAVALVCTLNLIAFPWTQT